jgi:molecular chaperone DnaJ
MKACNSAFRAKATWAPGGGPARDLIVLIEAVAHDDLTRDGNNVIYHLWLSFPEAALGAQIEVPTLDGKAKIKVDPGTQPGKVLRLKGKGFPDLNGYGTGDQLIQVKLYVPTKLSSEEKETLLKLQDSDHFKPDQGNKSFFDKMKDLF